MITNLVIVYIDRDRYFSLFERLRMFDCLLLWSAVWTSVPVAWIS